MKLLPLNDDTPMAMANVGGAGTPLDNENLTRENLKFSVKIFLCSLEPKILTQTIETGPSDSASILSRWQAIRYSILVLTELKENYLESVMISLPNYGAQLTLNEFLPLWRIIEDYVDKQKILSAGVCDFMLPLLSDLCDAAKVRDLHDVLPSTLPCLSL